MDLRFREVCEEYGIDPEDIERATMWASDVAERQAEHYDHDGCSGMVTDFDPCPHLDGVEGPVITAQHEKFQEIATAFSGLRSAIEFQPDQRQDSAG